MASKASRPLGSLWVEVVKYDPEEEARKAALSPAYLVKEPHGPIWRVVLEATSTGDRSTWDYGCPLEAARKLKELTICTGFPLVAPGWPLAAINGGKS